MRIRYLLALCGLSCSCQAQALSTQDLVAQAFKSPQGEASGVIDDGMSGRIRQTLPIAGPVSAHVVTMKRYARSDCRRFEIILSAKLARESGYPDEAAPLPRIQFNLCEDGTAPSDAPAVQGPLVTAAAKPVTAVETPGQVPPATSVSIQKPTAKVTPKRLKNSAN